MSRGGLVKASLRRIFRSLVHLYFRRVEVVGLRPGVDVGGRVFVANHTNALIDPILVLVDAPCDVSPLAKSTLWRIPGLRWLLDSADAVPVVRRRDDPSKASGSNDAMFEKVAEHLGVGGNILVFPEGTSHNEPKLLRLKTGAARMIELASRRGGLDLTFQAVGLEFDDRATFRSRAVVAYGPVRRVDALGATGEALVQALTTKMAEDLASLVVEGETWEERRLVLRVSELLRSEDPSLGFAAAVEIAQGVERARDALRRADPSRIEEVRSAVDAYFAALEEVAVGDDLFREPPRLSLPTRVLMLSLLPLAPFGLLLYSLPYQLPRLVARRSREEDVHSTLKLATGLVAYPVWALGWVTLAALVVPGLWLVPALLLVLLSPFATLLWIEHAGALLRPWRLSPRRVARLANLRTVALGAIERARSAASVDERTGSGRTMLE
jgi:glycerol-3-phosphate O-acyltransferase / dihydroxyacetone phosphate acyltransferase